MFNQSALLSNWTFPIRSFNCNNGLGQKTLTIKQYCLIFSSFYGYLFKYIDYLFEFGFFDDLIPKS